ncbi:MAG: GldG family protein [Gammaproteobacteria bacterium]|nr:GldG family protein [Gammaproteobacteria bacterium]
MKTILTSKFGLLIVGIATIALIAVLQLSLSTARLDLTEGKAYTLSQGTKSILTSLENPVELELFFSKSQTQNIPQIRTYAQRVRELLLEYVALSGGSLSLTETDPEPFSENEDRAALAGLTPAQSQAGSPDLYLGLVARGQGGVEQSIAFLHPARESQLEFDLSRAVYIASRNQAPKIGIITDLPVEGGMNFMAGLNNDPFVSVEQLKQTNDVTILPSTTSDIPGDIQLLMVIHPNGWSEQTRYAIDQYLMQGGNLAVFVDPHAEADDAAVLQGQPSQSDLPELFDTLGIEYDKDAIVTDAEISLAVRDPDSGRATRMLAWLGLQAEQVNAHRVTTDILSVNLATAGALNFEQSDLTVTPLLQTTPNSAIDDVVKVQGELNPKALYDGFAATGEPITLAALVQGRFDSGFEAAPQAPENAEATTQADVDTPAKAHISQSENEGAVLVVSDVDWLSDRMWVQVQDFFGQRLAQPFADNGKLLGNIAGMLTGDAALLDVRQHVQQDRPFAKVQAIQADAELKFRRKEQELLAELEATEAELAQLQQPADGDGTITLSEEQQQSLIDFQAKKLDIRKDLRNVQHQLGKDIEALGNRLKIIHIIAWPLLAGLLLTLYRRRLMA